MHAYIFQFFVGLFFPLYLGLDPAAFGFEGFPEMVRLDPSDAGFVDVIHSNGARFPLGKWPDTTESCDRSNISDKSCNTF